MVPMYTCLTLPIEGLTIAKEKIRIRHGRVVDENAFVSYCSDRIFPVDHGNGLFIYQVSRTNVSSRHMIEQNVSQMSLPWIRQELYRCIIVGFASLKERHVSGADNFRKIEDVADVGDIPW